MTALDPTIHEPARLRIMMILAGVDAADFNFLLATLGLTRGNISSHMAHLERAGYVEIRKRFNGKMPHTEYCLTDSGHEGLAQYWRDMDKLRRSGGVAG
jgi:DNA-binding transcriptional ArsR family regulator